MASSISFRPISIAPLLRKRLIRQNPERIRVSRSEVRTHPEGSGKELIFRIFEGVSDRPLLPGTPFRILALEADPALPLLPFQMGHFDYRIIKGSSFGNSAICGTNHDPTGSKDKLAIRVKEEVRKNIRGIGRAMASIAFNHAAVEGAKKFDALNVMDINFFLGLSRTAKITEVIDEDRGPVPFSEVDPADENVVINMSFKLTRAKYIPKIEIGPRTPSRFPGP